MQRRDNSSNTKRDVEAAEEEKLQLCLLLLLQLQQSEKLTYIQ